MVIKHATCKFFNGQTFKYYRVLSYNEMSFENYLRSYLYIFT